MTDFSHTCPCGNRASCKKKLPFRETGPQPIYHFCVSLAFSKLGTREFSSLGNAFRLNTVFLAFSQCFSGTKKNQIKLNLFCTKDTKQEVQRKGERSLDRSAVLQISCIWGEPLNYQVAVDFALIVCGFDWKLLSLQGNIPQKNLMKTSTLPWGSEQPMWALLLGDIQASFRSGLTGFAL